MNGMKGYVRNIRISLRNQIVGWLKPGVGALGRSCRLQGRIRLMNRWSRQHPKRMGCLVIGSLVAVLLSDLFLSAHFAANQTAPNQVAIANMDSVFRGLQIIQENKLVQQNTVLSLTDRGRILHRELDSLIALPNKSHQDSMRIIRDYKVLERIVKSLNNNGNA